MRCVSINVEGDVKIIESFASEEEAQRTPRVAASSYLNTAPLIWSFMCGGRLTETVELVTDTAPARCAEMLISGEADAALVPVIEYQRASDLLIAPDVCVGAREAVKSVVLATRATRLEDVRSIALDVESRTSAALIQIIFREFFRVAPRVVGRAPDVRRMLEEADAALIIGDPAMTFVREGLRVFDLATLWRELTGFGFVFAMWMTRRECIERVRAIDFAAARDEGLLRAEEIAEIYSRALHLPQRELVAYLRENISYELTDDMRAGLDLYFRLAHKHELTPRKLQPLRFL